MTKEELQAKMNKKQQEIEKIEKRVAKWTTGMNEEAKKIVAACELVYDDPKLGETRKAFKEYSESHGEDPTVYRQDYEWNKGPNFNEAYTAYRDLAEAKKTLSKYQIQLDKLTNFENEEKVEVIWSFLQDWRAKAYKWFLNNAKEYFELKKNQKEAFKKYLQSNYEVKNEDELDWRTRYNAEGNFARNYYNSIHTLTKNIAKIKNKFVSGEAIPESYIIDEELLNKTLDKEVKSKYERLVNDITHITGPITDASNLRISPTGEIDGIIEGEKGKAKVQTFSAGGYAIQVFHYRHKVTKIV